MTDALRIPRLIFLYGPPAVGKLTVAKAVAECRDFRVLHNHVTFDPVADVLPIGTPTFWATLDKVRLDLVAGAAAAGIDLVYTFVFAPGEERHADQVASAYESAGGTVLFVQLLAPPEAGQGGVRERRRAAVSCNCGSSVPLIAVSLPRSQRFVPAASTHSFARGAGSIAPYR
jgi:hypothetical protein